MAVNGDDRFWRAAWRATLPLWLWALQFFAGYAVLAAGAMGHLRAPVARAVALAIVALTAAVLLAIAVRAGRAWAVSGRRRGAEAFRAGAALVVLLAVAWAAVPLLALGPS